MSLVRQLAGAIGVLLVLSGPAQAAHPLITDDTGTQGKGRWQVETTGGYRNADNDNETRYTSDATLQVTYGVTEKVDVAVGIPYLRIHSKTGETSGTERGLSDTALSLKWRFWGKEDLSFAVEPGVLLPTGNDDRGLGQGKAGYFITLIASAEAKPFALSANLGYLRNENTLDQRRDIWYGSLDSEFHATENLKLVAEVAYATVARRTSGTNRWLCGTGLIYSVSPMVDLDVGYRFGLSTTEDRNAIVGGITFRF